MYLMGQGHEHTGPGTSMVQRVNWSQDQETQLRNALLGRGPGLGSVPEFAADLRQMTRYQGMGGCGCAGLAGCPCSGGLGLFDSGLDFSGWGVPEFAIVALGGYVLLSTVFTTQRATRRVQKSFKRYARRRAVAA
jgi:hypothetical protein